MRKHITETEYEVYEFYPFLPADKRINGKEVILKDTETSQLEVWFENDNFAGYTIEIEGIGYEFAYSLN